MSGSTSVHVNKFRTDALQYTPVFNGVNAEDFKPCAPDKEFQDKWNLSGKQVIGFIGSFYRYEGLDLLVRAFHRIADQFPDTVLLLVGGGPMESELKQLVKQLDRQTAGQPKNQYHGCQPVHQL